jgi:quercetin dioxygenase-like cupin family protein
MKTEMNPGELEYTAEKINTRAVFSTENFKAVELALSGNQELKTHTTPVDAMLIILEGKLEYSENEEKIILEKFDVFRINKAVPHSVKALESSRILLIR